jgi:TonB family protein
MKNFLSIYAVLAILQSSAQQDSVNIVKEEVFVIVEKMPEFPGGYEAMNAFIRKNIIYPATERDKKIEGKVYVQLLINLEGKVSEAKVIKGNIEAFNQEALRVVNMMPKWIPGEQAGKRVNCYYNLPIYFKL